MFMVYWNAEATLGGRALSVEEGIIQKLERTGGHLNLGFKYTVPEIIYFMKGVSSRDRSSRSKIIFEDD